ncbi:hypothetical protein SAMN05421837_103135 [Amycolatopsis pretoriensis]|uniref:Uncharacterized protein n=1 Tax=Amycolatopsis pretoriensis TaxID=218821 RepID=A0A1H5QJI8_9PSEU|nr:hypothetical protein [Amycolatopsis pretoriensis]SEF26219.1 hypothetical protein SAMN05421837_103135 [Amycolatopsis pretoriensis]
MARTGGEGDIPSVAELVNLSQTKPLMIRGDLDEMLAREEPAPEPKPDPLAILDAELAAPEPDDERPLEAPPAESRRTKPYVLAAGAAVALGLAAVVLFQPQQVGGTATPPPGATAPAAPPASSDAVETMSATAEAPPLTAKVRDSPVRTTNPPAAAGRKPANPTTSAPPAEDQWQQYVSSVVSSWQHQHPHGRPNR